MASRAGYFALKIDTLNGMADTFKRKAIARDILVCIGALPQ
jgi:beta-lactamase class D